MQWVRERLALVLLCLLPLHALAVTVGTRVIRGPGLPPWGVLAVWKEALLGAVLLLAIIEIVWSAVRQCSATLRRTDRQAAESGVVHAYRMFTVDVIDLCLLALFVLSVLVHPWTAPGALTAYVLGFRYDLMAPLAFLVLRRVPWSAWCISMTPRCLIGIGAVVAAYGLLTLVLPLQFFLSLGYSAAHSLYDPAGPIAAFQLIAESTVHRVQSTMSGPNQLGLWLLLPLAAVLAQGKVQWRSRWAVVVLVVLVLCVGATFSRTSWIATCMLIATVVWMQASMVWRRRLLLWGVPTLCILALVGALLSPKVIFRLSSTRGHFEKPIEGLMHMVQVPWGMGLGSAGPASNRLKEPCVFLRPQDDPSWAKATPELCVFLGKTQVQPSDHACDCPLLTENWFVQIGVELGWLGMGLWLAMTLRVAERLWNASRRGIGSLPLMLLAAWIALGVASLLLHAWEDAALAYTVYILLAMALPARVTAEKS